MTEKGGHSASTAALTLGALGVVFGDIGTSPLYTLRQCLLEASGGKAVAQVIEVGIQLDL